MLRASYLFLDRSHSICESMVAGTAAGEMTFLSRTKRNATVVAERDSVLWKMEVASHEEMGKNEGWAFCRQFEQCLMRIACEEQEGKLPQIFHFLRLFTDDVLPPFPLPLSSHGTLFFLHSFKIPS